MPAQAWGYAILLGFGATVAATLLMNEGLRRIGPQRGAIISCISPAAALSLGWLVLHEIPSLGQVAGMLIAVLGATVIALEKIAAMQQRKSHAYRRRL